MAQLLADLVALSSGEDVAAFHHHDLAHLDSSFCEESPPVDRAFTLLDLWREMTEVELALAHSFTSDWPWAWCRPRNERATPPSTLRPAPPRRGRHARSGAPPRSARIACSPREAAKAPHPADPA